jgi:hypothetical protein
MRMKIVAILLMLAAPATLMATSIRIPGPYPWSMATDSGEFLFVMTVESDHWASKWEGWGDERVNRMKYLHNTYSASGLYRNDGSTEPLWIFEGYLDGYSVILLDDGEHMVVPGGVDGSAVSFYRSGKLTRTWRVEELVKFSGGYKTRWDSELAQYRVRTLEGYEYTFDGKTGELVDSAFCWDWDSRLLRYAVHIAAFVTILGGSMWLIRRFRRRRIDASTASTKISA